MSIKVERRGKYAGCKVHLEPDQCKLLMKLAEKPTPELFEKAGILAQKMGKKMLEVQKEFSDMLEPRTEEQIQHELEVEFESAQKKLEARKQGQNWKDIHIK